MKASEFHLIGNKPFVLALLLTVILAGYSLNLNSYFLSDDFRLIYAAAHGNKSVFSCWLSNWVGSRSGGFYRPLIIISLYFNYLLGGLNPLGYHLTNILFHFFSSVLVYLICSNLFSSPNTKRIAFLATLFFAIHPRHTEAVSWISGRTDVICATFFLLAFLLYLKFKQKGSGLFLVFSLLSFLGSLTAKEMAVSLPLLIAAYEIVNSSGGAICPEASGFKRFKGLIYSGPYWIILIFYLVFRWRLLGSFLGRDVSLDFLMLRAVEMTAGSAAALFIPGNLNIMAVVSLFTRHLSFFLFVAIIAFSLLIIYLSRDRSGTLIFAVFWFFITLLPVANLYISLADTQGERFLYLPSVGFSLSLAYLLINMKRKIVSRGFCCFLLLFFFVSLLSLNMNWRDAGKISRRIILNTERVVGEDSICYLTLPDNLKGAYIFRHGISPAIRLHYPWAKTESVLELTKIYLNKPAEKSPIKWGRERDYILGEPLNKEQEYFFMYTEGPPQKYHTEIDYLSPQKVRIRLAEDTDKPLVYLDMYSSEIN